jgi:hypothetical protein
MMVVVLQNVTVSLPAAAHGIQTIWPAFNTASVFIYEVL